MEMDGFEKWMGGGIIALLSLAGAVVVATTWIERAYPSPACNQMAQIVKLLETNNELLRQRVQ